MQVELFFMTDTGCKWLVETFEAEDHEDMLRQAKTYYTTHIEQAKQLLDGWHRNGEDVTLTADFEIKTCEYERGRFKRELIQLFDRLDKKYS
jgi:hypothetical protein